MKKFTTFLFATVAATALLSSDAMAAKHKKAKKARKKAPHAVECPSKVSAPVTAVAAVAAPCASTNMSGFYLGASAGAALNTHEAKFATGNDSQKFIATGSKVLPAFGLFGGYNFQMGSALLGAELLVSHDSKTMDVWSDESRSGDYPYVSVKKGFSAGLAARLGFLLNNSTNLYVRFGVERSNLKLEVKSNDTVVNANKTTYNKKAAYAFIPGFGVETFVNSNVFMRAEYNYAISKRLTVEENRVSYMYSGATGIVNVKPRQHIVKVAVGYKF